MAIIINIDVMLARRKMSELLVEHSADTSARDNEGHAPPTRCGETGRPDPTRFLR